MDWLWPLYEEHVRREAAGGGAPEAVPAADLQRGFLAALGESTATLYVMEPVGDTIRFKGLGRWPLAEVPELIADPNGFIAERFGGGKYKINFHRGFTFVATHNFRTYGDERWREAEEIVFHDE